jgi:hypothetical protein
MPFGLLPYFLLLDSAPPYVAALGACCLASWRLGIVAEFLEFLPIDYCVPNTLLYNQDMASRRDSQLYFVPMRIRKTTWLSLTWFSLFPPVLPLAFLLAVGGLSLTMRSRLPYRVLIASRSAAL